VFVPDEAAAWSRRRRHAVHTQLFRRERLMIGGSLLWRRGPTDRGSDGPSPRTARSAASCSPTSQMIQATLADRRDRALGGAAHHLRGRRRLMTTATTCDLCTRAARSPKLLLVGACEPHRRSACADLRRALATCARMPPSVSSASCASIGSGRAPARSSA
jgi:hypothetical protein